VLHLIAIFHFFIRFYISPLSHRLIIDQLLLQLLI